MDTEVQKMEHLLKNQYKSSYRVLEKNMFFKIGEKDDLLKWKFAIR